MRTRFGTWRKSILAGILVLDLAGAFLLWTLRDTVFPREWRQTSGVVVATHEQDSGADTGGYCFVVQFRYTADGTTYVGDKHRSTNPCLAPSTARQERYRPGSPVALWYDVDEPSFAVIDPRYEWDGPLIWCVLLLLIVLGNLDLIGRVRVADSDARQSLT